METWKNVVGFEGVYQVSDLGRVRSETAMLAPYFSDKGYLWVTLTVKTRNRRSPKPHPVARLVLSAFRGPRPDGYGSSHDNAVETDNRLSNLQWSVRPEYTSEGAYKSPDTTRQAGHPVYRSDGIRFTSAGNAAKMTGVLASSVHAVCNGGQHNSNGFGFKWVEDCDGTPWELEKKPDYSTAIYRSDGVWFPSLARAAHSVDSIPSQVVRTCKGLHSEIKGFGFRFASDWKGGPWDLEQLAPPKASKCEDPPVPVVRSDGEWFPSLYAASQDIDRLPHHVKSVCRGATRQCAGYDFRYAKPEDTPTEVL